MTVRRVVLEEPMPHQVDLLADSSRFKVAICGRRWGKTQLGMVAAIVGHGPTCHELPGALAGGHVWWVAPNYTVATEVWDRLSEALKECWVRKDEVKRRFLLPGGGVLAVKSADTPDSLRGSGLNGLVLDEVKDQPKSVWKTIRPALSDKRGWGLFMGTPSGPDESNLAYHLWLKAERSPGWTRWQRPSSDNPILTPEELADMRDELGAFAFARECEAQFNAEEGEVFKAEWFRFFGEPGPGLVSLPGLHRTWPVKTLPRFGVADLATSTKTRADWTALGAFAVAPSGELLVLGVERRRVEGARLAATIDGFLDAWGLPVVYVEQSGFHGPLVQDLKRAGLPIRPLVDVKDKFSRSLPAQAAMDAGRVWFPKSAPWLEDFRSELLAFPDPSSHDDQVDVLSYAVTTAKTFRAGGAPPARPRGSRAIPGLDAERPS